MDTLYVRKQLSGSATWQKCIECAPLAQTIIMTQQCNCATPDSVNMNNVE